MKYPVALLTVSLALLPASRAHAEIDFVKDIKPILEERCLKCHLGEKPRGGLLMDTKEHLLKGGKEKKAKVLIPGKGAESEMFKLVNLPEDDENRMPPLVSEKPLPKDQAAKLKTWIDEGAKWPDGLVLKSVNADNVVKDDPGVPITEQEKAGVAKLEKTGVLAIRLAQNTNLLRVDFSLRGKEVKDEDLALLKDMPNLTELNLGGTTITNASLAHLKGLKHLTRLQLHNTKITDAGLDNLKDLTKLASLNLYGCAEITDAGLDHLKSLTGLRRLYVWQTKVTEAGANKFSAAVPGVIVDHGIDKEAPKPKEEKKDEKKEEKKDEKK